MAVSADRLASDQLRHRIAAAADRAREFDECARLELATRDSLIIQAIDEGCLSTREAARAAGVSQTRDFAILGRG